MIKIDYTHTSNSGSSAKLFTVATEDLTIDVKVPNQARQIIGFAMELGADGNQFTYNELVAYIDENHVGTFTQSTGGTMRIVRYYSKLLQDAGVLIAA